jgi:hypothetical protein
MRAINWKETKGSRTDVADRRKLCMVGNFRAPPYLEVEE